MIETVLLDSVSNKNKQTCKIGNRKWSAVLYSAVVPPWYSILFYLIQVVRIECNRRWNIANRKSGKAKTKVACGDDTKSWNQAESMSAKWKCVYDLDWNRNPAYKQCLVSYCLWKMTPGKNVNSPWKVLEKSWNFDSLFLYVPCVFKWWGTKWES